jgi:hypothetical protein
MLLCFLVSSCSNCQLNAIRNEMNIVPNASNKRRANMLVTTDFDSHDGVVPVLENPPKLEQSLSEPVSPV